MFNKMKLDPVHKSQVHHSRMILSILISPLATLEYTKTHQKSKNLSKWSGLRITFNSFNNRKKSKKMKNLNKMMTFT